MNLNCVFRFEYEYFRSGSRECHASSKISRNRHIESEFQERKELEQKFRKIKSLVLEKGLVA